MSSLVSTPVFTCHGLDPRSDEELLEYNIEEILCKFERVVDGCNYNFYETDSGKYATIVDDVSKVWTWAHEEKAEIKMTPFYAKIKIMDSNLDNGANYIVVDYDNIAPNEEVCKFCTPKALLEFRYLFGLDKDIQRGYQLCCKYLTNHTRKITSAEIENHYMFKFSTVEDLCKERLFEDALEDIEMLYKYNKGLKGCIEINWNKVWDNISDDYVQEDGHFIKIR
jgi:hypothetical protein